MAFSSSIRKAQIVKLCELCETETNLKWRCIQCDTILCDKCKKIHNKVQTNTQHQIVDLKTRFQDVEQKVILDNIKCDEHKTKMTCLFCRNCDHLVCPDCISSKHNKHNFEPVEKILSEKLDELKGAEARYCKDLTFCRAKVEEFQISETKYESLFDETITKIKEREQTMIDSIRKYSIELQKQIELDRKSEKKKFLNIKREADQAEKTIIHHQDEIMAALKSIQGSTIFATATKFKKMMPDLNFNPSEIKYFIPGKETVNDIPNLFGSLQCEGPLEFLRTQPQFHKMKKLIQQNSQVLPALLQQIGQSNPPLLQLISQHQERFIQMLNAPLDEEGTEPSAQGGGGLGPPPTGGEYTSYTTRKGSN